MNLLRLLLQSMSKLGELIPGETKVTPATLPYIRTMQTLGATFQALNLTTSTTDPALFPSVNIEDWIPRLNAVILSIHAEHDPFFPLLDGAPDRITKSNVQTIFLSQKNRPLTEPGLREITPDEKWWLKDRKVAKSDAEEKLIDMKLVPTGAPKAVIFDLKIHNNVRLLMTDAPCSWVPNLKELHITLWSGDGALFQRSIIESGDSITSLDISTIGNTVMTEVWKAIYLVSDHIKHFSYRGAPSAEYYVTDGLKHIAFPKLKTLRIEYARLPQANFSNVALKIFSVRALKGKLVKKMPEIKFGSIWWYRADVTKDSFELLFTQIKSDRLVIKSDCVRVDRRVRLFCPSVTEIRFEGNLEDRHLPDDAEELSHEDDDNIKIKWIFSRRVSDYVINCICTPQERAERVERQ